MTSDTIDDILAEALTADGWGAGLKSGHPPWEIDIRVRGDPVRGRANALFARLFVYGQLIVGLDFHATPMAPDAQGTRIPAGYHWDVWPPLVDGYDRLRVWIERQPRNVREALELLFQLWHIKAAPDVRTTFV